MTSTVPTPAAMDSAGSRRESGVSPFADSADSSSPSNVSTDHIPIDVLFESTSGGINEFFLTSDAEEQIGMSRVAVDPDSDDEVLAEILFRGKYISGAGVVVVDKLPDDEIVDPRVKVETVRYMPLSSSDTLTVPPSYCRDVVVAGSVIQTVQTSLRQSFECLASAPFACTARQMVFSSPWLTPKKESGSPLQTALVCFSNPLIALLELDVVFYGFFILRLEIAAGYIVSAGICDAAGSFVLADLIYICCLLCFCCYSILLLREDLSRNLELTESKPIVPAGSSSSVPADYVSAGHVLVSADRDRIC
ncbi:hypothetical protein Tco_0825247 [Tanacetum coccineum]